MDLLRAGVIGDPYYRFGDTVYRWITENTWTYTRTFSVSSTFLSSFNTINLVATGLDTVANITINNQSVGYANNMFRLWIYNINNVLVSGQNTISITFASPVFYALEQEQSYTYDLPPSGIQPNCPPALQNGICHVNFIRKEQCSFSWDWGPAYAPSGIYRSIWIEGYASAVIRNVLVFPNPTVSSDLSEWNLTSTVIIDGGSQSSVGTLTVQIVELQQNVSVKVSVPAGESEITVSMITKNVDLWWPNGYGSPSLYTLIVTYQTATDINSTQLQFGFRTVELIQEQIAEDVEGLTFYYRINNVPVFFKGANWIPADAFEQRVTSEVLQNLLQSAVDANMNGLRNWGGGIYQQDLFYTLADQMGLMIWEEFMFACALYPTDPAWIDNVAAEVRDQIRRLQYHPSIIVWSGNNENEAALAENWWGVANPSEDYYPMYADLYFDTVKTNVTSLDTSRPFISSSPSNGNETAENPVAPNPQNTYYGDVHYYNYDSDCWDVSSFPRPRFTSEYGFQSYPSFITLSNVSIDEDWSFNSTWMNSRQHHPDGDQQIFMQIDYHFPRPNNPDPLQQFKNVIWLNQIEQGMCIKTESEHYRRIRNNLDSTGQGYTMGAIYWQLNDIWQGASWASLEYGGRWKVLHYYAKNFFAPVLVSGYMDDGVGIFVVSDLQYNLTASLSVELWSWNGPVTQWQVPNIDVIALSGWQQWEASMSNFTSFSQCESLSDCFLIYTLTNKANAEVLSTNWLFLGSPVNATFIPNPTLFVDNVIQNDTNIFQVQINAQSVAAFVWLETVFPGRWSDNGFIMTQPTATVQWYSWDPTVTLELFSNTITVSSLASLIYS